MPSIVAGVFGQNYEDDDGSNAAFLASHVFRFVLLNLCHCPVLFVRSSCHLTADGAKDLIFNFK